MRELPALKTVEAALRESRGRLHVSEVRLRRMLDYSPAVATSQDRDLRYTWVHAYPAFGQDQLLGKTDHDLFPPEDAAHVTEIKRRVLTTGVGIREEVRLMIQEDEVFYDLSVEPLLDENGAIVGVSGVATDITAWKRDEEQLAHRRTRLDHIARATSRIDGDLVDENSWSSCPGDGYSAGGRGTLHVSPREREVIKCLLGYRRLSVVAEVLGISVHTARNHLKSVFRKLHLRSQDELFRYFLTSENGASLKSWLP